VSSTWFFFSILAPPIAAIICRRFFSPENPDPQLVIIANTLMPGSGLAMAGRPVLEITLGVLMAQISMLIAGGPFVQYLFPVAVIGAGWATIYTPFNPLTAQGLPKKRENQNSFQGKVNAPLLEQVGGMSRLRKEEQDSGVEGYSINIRCTECGADVSVPVLQHAAQCPFCGSHHLVVGHEALLQLAIPEAISSEHELREKLLEHFRYRYYLKLYKKHVAPLERQATSAGPQGGLAVHHDMVAAAEAAERHISARADAWKEKLRPHFKVDQVQRFFSPYYHSMGTLYQAAFGREKQSRDKKLRFTLAQLETALAAQKGVELPEMGKLSYLKALRPVEELPEGSRVLQADLPMEIVEKAHRRFENKKLDRSIDTIEVGSVFSEEIRAVVWRPWIVASVTAQDRKETFLVEGASGSVTGEGLFINEDILEELSRPAEHASLRFQPMECPTCGWEFRYDIDARLHFCTNCHRVFEADAGGKREINYDHEGGEENEKDLIPFWRFPLRIRSGTGELLTDFAHFRDGIDGRLDQIGDSAPVGQDFLWIPAIRCINAKLTRVALENLLIHTLRRPHRIRKGRFPLDLKVQPWPAILDEVEARRVAPLLLARIFNARDIARVQVAQVRNWIFDARLESDGRLCYLSIPTDLSRAFRAYIGRSRVAGLPPEG